MKLSKDQLKRLAEVVCDELKDKDSPCFDSADPFWKERCRNAVTSVLKEIESPVMHQKLFENAVDKFTRWYDSDNSYLGGEYAELEFLLYPYLKTSEPTSLYIPKD